MAPSTSPALSLDSVKAHLRTALAHGGLMLTRLDTELSGLAWLNMVAQKTGASRVPHGRVAIFLSLCAAAFAFLFLGFGAAFFSTIIGVAYPAIASMKAIEAQQGGATPVKHDEAQWLTYWVVFAVFSVLETASDFVLYWLPMYYFLKVAFLLYCQLPMFRGAEFLYATFLRPLFLRNQQRIDAQFERLQGASTALKNVIGFDPLARAAEGGAGAAVEGAAASGMPGGGAGEAAMDVTQIFGAGAPGTGGAGAGEGSKNRRD